MVVVTVPSARTIFAYCSLLALSLIFFSDLLSNGRLFTERDLGVFFVPPRFFWVESLKAGEFPLWNPLNFAGHPFFATLQPAMLYPPNLLFFIFPFDDAFNGIIIGHFFLAGAFTFALLRSLEADRWSAFLGAATFMLGGYLLSVHNLLSTLLSVTWAPLILLLFRASIIRNSPRHAAGAGAVLTLSFLGGGIEVVLGVAMAMTVMALWTCRLGGAGIFRTGKLLAVAGVAFLGLSAVQLIPFLELSAYSVRKDGLSYAEAVVWSVSPVELLAFLIPDPYGSMANLEKYWFRQSWLKTIYVGALPLVLAAYYVVKGGKERPVWLTISALSLFFALGGHNPLYPYLYEYVPGISKVRYPVKFLFLTVLALCVMAGLGLHALMESARRGEGRRFGRVALCAAVGGVLALLGLNIGHEAALEFLRDNGLDAPVFNDAAVNLHNGKRMLVYLVVGCAVLWYMVRRKGSRLVVAVFCLILIADLLGNLGYYKTSKPEDYWSSNWTVRHIQSNLEEHRVLVTPKTGRMPVIAPDVTPETAAHRTLQPALNLNYHIPDMWGAEVLRVKRTDDLYHAMSTSPSVDATRIADLFSVKYVVSTLSINSDDFELVGADLEGIEGDRKDLLDKPTIKLYRNTRVLPRAMLVREYLFEPDPAAVLSHVSRQDFDPTRAVVLEETPAPDPRLSSGSVAGKRQEAKTLNESNNGMELLVRAVEPSFLYLADTFYPGWNVYVDGIKTKIYRANYNFRAVLLPPGEHRVAFRYEPWSFKSGLVLTAISLIACVMWMGIGNRRQPKAL